MRQGTKKLLLRTTGVLLCAVMTTGCAAEVTQEPVVAQPQPSSQVLSEPLNVELVRDGVITVYRAFPNSDVLESVEVKAPDGEVTIWDVINAVETVLDEELPIRTITQQQGLLVIDVSHQLFDRYPKREIYPLLTAVGVTLRENHKAFEQLQYQVDGEVGMLGELYTLPPLKLANGSAQDYAAIRASIPYEGLFNEGEQRSLIEMDDTSRQILRYLGLLEVIDKDVTSASELGNQYLIQTAIFHTQHYSIDSYDKQFSNYREELSALQESVSEKLGMVETWFWMEEHVQESTRLIFGDEVTIRHTNLKQYPYLYMQTEGVYTPPHMGIWSAPVPFLLGYQDLGDSYRVEMAFVLSTMNGYVDPDKNDDVLIGKEDIDEYVRTTSRRREVILKKQEDGRVTLVSHRYL